MLSIIYHLIRLLYRKNCSIIKFTKNTDKISEYYIFNVKLT